MGIDAVAVLRVRSRALLRERLQAADMRENAIEPLVDGAAKLSTYLRYPRNEEEQHALCAFLTGVFGEDLPRIHDDPRGVLFFPDITEPRATTYDALVEEVRGAGLWLRPATPADIERRGAEMARQVEQMVSDMRARMAAGVATGAAAVPVDTVAAAPDVDPLAALIAQAGHQSIDDLLAWGDKALAEGALGELLTCALVQRRTPLPAPLPDANEVVVLSDGAHVIASVHCATAVEDFAWRLGDRNPEWIDEHRDPRGRAVFSQAHLGEVRGASGYDDAVARLGARGAWARPVTSQDLEAAHDEAVRRYFDDDGG